MVATTIFVNLLILGSLIYQFFMAPSGTLWYLILYGMILSTFFTLAYRLKKRVAQLVEASAQRTGLKRVKGR